jgi:signal peptidase I
MTSSDIDQSDSGGDALGRAHDAVDAMRLEADDAAEDARASRSFWRELPILILIALAVAVLLKTFVLQAFYIPSSSMEETLAINDRVIVSKLSYRFGDVDRFDVIVFDDPRSVAGSRDESFLEAVGRNLAESVGLSTPKSEFIKRVVALPGETVEVRGGVVLVNGGALVEPYATPPADSTEYGPEVVPAGHVFVMGDNRPVSQDSRVFGPVPIDDIVGRAFSVIWPPGSWSGL